MNFNVERAKLDKIEELELFWAAANEHGITMKAGDRVVAMPTGDFDASFLLRDIMDAIRSHSDGLSASLGKSGQDWKPPRG